mgnify:CR=1 FL=1
MDVDVYYGRDKTPVEVDEARVAGIYYPNSVESGEEDKILRDALDNPVESPSFRERRFLS